MENHASVAGSLLSHVNPKTECGNKRSSAKNLPQQLSVRPRGRATYKVCQEDSVLLQQDGSPSLHRPKYTTKQSSSPWTSQILKPNLCNDDISHFQWICNASYVMRRELLNTDEKPLIFSGYSTDENPTWLCFPTAGEALLLQTPAGVSCLWLCVSRLTC